MSYTNELIDRYKIAIKVDSDYAVAKALGLRPNRISNYRTGISHADDKTAVMLATVLHLDPMETIARINMDRANDKEDKAFWRRFAGTAAMVLCAIGFSMPVAGNAHATRDSHSWISDESQSNAYYVKADWAWWARLLARPLNTGLALTSQTGHLLIGLASLSSSQGFRFVTSANVRATL